MLPIAKVSTKTWDDTWQRQLAKSLIGYLCEWAELKAEFVPYGLAGENVSCFFRCLSCGSGFSGEVSMFNEEEVECQNCKTRYKTGNNGDCAWIISVVPESKAGA